MQPVGRPKGIPSGHGKTLEERKEFNRIAAKASRKKANKRRHCIAKNLKELKEYVASWQHDIQELGGKDLRIILWDMVKAVDVLKTQSEPDYKHEADLTDMCGLEFEWVPEKQRTTTPELPDLGEPEETFTLKDIDLFSPIEPAPIATTHHVITPVFKKF